MASRVRKEQQITMSDLLYDKPCIAFRSQNELLTWARQNISKTRLSCLVQQIKDTDVTKGQNWSDKMLIWFQQANGDVDYTYLEERG